MTKKYTPHDGDIIKITKGTPDMLGYTESIKEVSLDPSMADSIHLNVVNYYLEQQNIWTIELLKRRKFPLPTEPGSIVWTSVGDEDNRYIAVLHDSDMWRTVEDNPTYVHGSELTKHRTACLVPDDVMDKARDWFRETLYSTEELRAQDAITILEELVFVTEGEEKMMEEADNG